MDGAPHAVCVEPAGHHGLDLRGNASRILAVEDLLHLAEELARGVEGNSHPARAQDDNEEQEDRGDAGIEGPEDLPHPESSAGSANLYPTPHTVFR